MNSFRTARRIAAVFMAFVMLVFLVSPAVRAAGPEPAWNVPSGYNAHDYNALASFLEQTGANDVRNGELLSENYDPGDPTTWPAFRFGFTTVGGQKRIELLDLSNVGQLAGELDLSDCTSLTNCSVYTNRISSVNVRGCTQLNTFYCYDNRLTEVDVTTNTNLRFFNCARNDISALDVSRNTQLILLSCGFNPLSGLNVSANTSLQTLYCSSIAQSSIDISHNTQLKDFYFNNNGAVDIDTSHNSQLPINGIHAVGDGTVGCELTGTGHSYFVFAVPNEGAEFTGWYDQNGALFSEEPETRFYSGSVSRLYAHFTEVPVGLMGDVDLNGTVEVVDALLAMRYAMGVIGLAPEQLAVGDIDGNGTVDITDALMILRMAMGII